MEKKEPVWLEDKSCIDNRTLKFMIYHNLTSEIETQFQYFIMLIVKPAGI